jgi:anti-sigma regulatory factor (Ser/Thr protein kinase)/ActR/RegA family two-component response regulator
MTFAAATCKSPVSGSAEKSVLVVADRAIDIRLFDQLTARGWIVEYVPDNEAALSTLQNRAFDLVITAEKTCAKEDLALLHRMRTVHPHCRMIIVTGESTTQDVISALRAHAFSYFSAPYSFEALSEMVRMAVECPCWDDGIEVVSATSEWIRLLARCDKATAERLVQFFHEMADLSEEEKSKVGYAFREMLLNAMRHGARFDPNQYVEISYVRARHMVACRVKDPGEGFRLDELYHAAITNPPDNPVRHVHFREATGLPPGGYGILLSRHLLDELIYNERGNEVLLVKYLSEKMSAEKS